MTYTQIDSGLIIPTQALQEAIQRVEARANQLLEEQAWHPPANLVEADNLADMLAEDVGWRRLGTWSGQYTKPQIDAVAARARHMNLRNPIFGNGVRTISNYVFGAGINVTCKQPEIQVVLNAFNDDNKNKVELTSQQARLDKDKEQRLAGNTFLVFFPNPVTGQVRVRSIPPEEVLDILCNPEDAKEPYYYLRQWVEQGIDEQGHQTSTTHRAYYPDWRYNPVNKPGMIGRDSIRWESPVYHIKTGGYSNWKFGICEVWAAIDWARAYKEFLEDVATIMRAYSRFAFQITTKGGKSAIQAAYGKLNTKLGGAGGLRDTNPPEIPGSIFIGSEDVQLDPVKASPGIKAEDGQRFVLMVAAAFGIPGTMLNGDVDVGNHATAKTLDRPTELGMLNRQTLWSDIFTNIYNYVILWAVKAHKGALRHLATIDTVVMDGQIVETLNWADNVMADVQVSFPPVVGADTMEMINAIVEAATLGGKSLAGTMSWETVARMLLEALGQQNVDELLAQAQEERDAQQVQQALSAAPQSTEDAIAPDGIPSGAIGDG